MGRIRDCLFVCLLVITFFMLAVAVVFFVTFLSPSILSLDKMEVKRYGNTTPVRVERFSSTITKESGSAQATTLSALKEAGEVSDSSTSTTLSYALKDNTRNLNISDFYIFVELEKESIPPPSRKLYSGDDLIVIVNSARGDDAVYVSLDGALLGESAPGQPFRLRELTGGEHEITVSGGGYSARTTVSVWNTRYGLSQDVRKLLSDEERESVIADGKANLRFYDIPNCPNCIVMRPKVAEIVEKYRHCVAYELLSFWKPSGREDLKRFFPDQSRVVTPVIIIEGLEGKVSYMGIVPPEKLVEDILEFAPACRQKA